MAQEARSTVLAGIVIVVGVIALIFFSLQSSGRGWFYHGYEIKARFATAKGIETGSEVVLSGVPIGHIDKIDVDNKDGSVTMTLLIDEPHTIPQDSVGSIRLKTLLGNYHVYIDFGTPGVPPLKDGASLQTTEYKDIQQALQDIGSLADKFANLGGGAGAGLGSLQSSAEGLISKINAVIDENRPNIQATTKALADSSPKLSQAIDEITSVTHSLNTGTGTIPRLLNSNELYDHFSDIANNFQTFSHDINEGDGTVAKLVHDPEMANKIARGIDDITSTSAGIREVVERNGPKIDNIMQQLGDAAPKIGSTMDSFASVGKKIDAGEGTLGKLVNDPELYNSVRDAVNQIRRTFEEGEEQGVMRTFLGVFFGSML